MATCVVLKISKFSIRIWNMASNLRSACSRNGNWSGICYNLSKLFALAGWKKTLLVQEFLGDRIVPGNAWFPRFWACPYLNLSFGN
jgi:hypothetical protein